MIVVYSKEQIVQGGGFNDIYNLENFEKQNLVSFHELKDSIKKVINVEQDRFVNMNSDTYKTWDEVKQLSGKILFHKWNEFYGLVDSVYLDYDVPVGFPNRFVQENRIDTEVVKSISEYFKVESFEGSQKKLLTFSNTNGFGNEIEFNQVLELESLGAEIMTDVQSEFLISNYDDVNKVFNKYIDVDFGNHLKIWRWRAFKSRVEKRDYPYGVIHQSGLSIKLISKLTFFAGQIIKAEYFHRKENGDLEPILYITFNWVRDGQYVNNDWRAGVFSQDRALNDGKGDCIYRVTNSYYYREDETVHSSWEKVKEYDTTRKKYNEKIRQRKNSLNDLEQKGVDVGLDIAGILKTIKEWKEIWIDNGVGGLSIGTPDITYNTNINFRWIINERSTDFLNANDILLLNYDLPEPFNRKVYEAIIAETDI